MIIKLNPGDRINLTISKADVVEGNYGPQYKFSGTTPTDPDAVLFLNVDTAERQLARAGFASVASALGQTVEVEKVERDGKKFTNINRVSGAVVAKEQAAVAANAKQGYSSGPNIQGLDDAPATGKLDALFTLYRTCFNEAASVAKGVPAGVQVTHEGIAAQAATLFIQASQRGIAA